MKACVVGLAAIVGAACTSNGVVPFASLGGDFTGSVMNGPNTCPGTWEKGMMSSTTVTIGQVEANVTVHFSGPPGSMLQAVLGTNSFSGIVSGNHVSARIIGTVQATSGDCVYTTNGDLAADLGGNTLSGNIVYTPQTNNHADCTSMQVTGCTSQQTFALNRPPK